MNLNTLELFEQFVINDFKMRYKNSYLGILWVILKPLSMFAISYFVWSNIFGTDPTFKQSLLLGLIIIMFFSELIMMGLSSLQNRAYIILKINFKREVAVYSATSIAVIDLFVNMIIYTIFSYGSQTVMSLLGIGLFLLAILTLYLLCVGITFFLSIWFIKLRDLLNLVELTIQLLYWATPIFYPITLIPERFQPYIMNNPLTIVVTAARDGLIRGDSLSTNSFIPLIVLFFISIAVFLLGQLYFKKKITKIAEYF